MMWKFPLDWPLGFPRSEEQKAGRFSSLKDHYNTPLTDRQAATRMLSELDKFNKVGHPRRVPLDSVVVTSNLEARKDGTLAQQRRNPEDRGVAVYFELDGRSRVIPCDTYHQVADNLAAVAATLSALRTLERHGTGLMERAFTGFEALPAPTPKSWWVVLGVKEDTPNVFVQAAYVRLRSQHHPDKPTGDTDKFMEVQNAWRDFKAIRGFQ